MFGVGVASTKCNRRMAVKQTYMSPAIVKPMINSISLEYLPILEHADIGTRHRHIVFKAQGVIIDTGDVKNEARNDRPKDDAGYIHRVFS
jgi:hypothetical protein